MYARIWWMGMLLCCVGCGGSERDSGSTATSASKKVPLQTADHVGAENTKVTLDPVATALRGAPVSVGAVKTLQFNPAGDRLAVGSGDGVVRIWRVAERAIDVQFRAHDNWAFEVDFNHDGKTLVSGGGDNLIKLWDSASGQQKEQTAEQGDDIHGVAFSPDDQLIVAGSDDTQAVIWDLTSGERKTLSGHEQQITDVAMRPDGRQFATSSRDGTIRLWSLPDGAAEGTLNGHTADVIAITYSSDGKTLASAGYDKTVRLWDIAGGGDPRVLKGHQEWVFCLAFSPDGDYLFSGSADQHGILWNVETGKFTQMIAFGGDVSAADFSPDGRQLAIGLASGVVAVNRFDRGQLSHLHSLVPPREEKAAPATSQVSPTEYLTLHRRAEQPDDAQWSAAVGQLATAGDGFSLQVLSKIDESRLSAAQKELLRRTRDAIVERTEIEDFDTAATMIQPRLERAAAAELLSDPLAEQLVHWTLNQIGAVSDENRPGKELKRLQTQYEPPDTFVQQIQKEAEKTGDAQSVRESARVRVRGYARQILHPDKAADGANR